MSTVPARISVCLLFTLLTACWAPSGSQNDASTAGGDVDAAGVTVEGALGEKPTITLPDGDPPSELVTDDIAVGDGAEATPGATVTAHYVGVAWSSGEQFDASWDRGQPIPFSLDRVVAGWSEGIPGMKVGGRRVLVIPPDLGYRNDPPSGSGIQPGDTLVFVVDLIDVQ